MNDYNARADASRTHHRLQARSDDLGALWLRHDSRRGEPGPDSEHWRLTPQSVWDVVKRDASVLGIHTPHAFGPAMASAMLEDDAPISLIQELLGHSSPTVTRQVYTHNDQHTVRKGFDRYNPTVSQQVAKLKA